MREVCLYSDDFEDRALSRYACTEVANDIFEELTTPVSPIIVSFVQKVLGQARPLGVIFYGSALREGIEANSLLDFYIIVRHQRDWSRPWASALSNALLPPNVEYHEHQQNGQIIRAKIAILSLAQLQLLTGRQTYNTTVWARFSQPCRLVWVKDNKAFQQIGACIVRACVTAAFWGAVLGPKSGSAYRFWEILYQQTYNVELRVEQHHRSRHIVERDKHRYEKLLLPCWQMMRITYKTQQNGFVRLILTPFQRNKAIRHWRLCQTIGRPLNVMRLLKAAYTFKGGARYVAWKIQRHSDFKIVVTPFMEKHPLLAGLPLLWRLWRRGLFKRNKIKK